MAAAFLTSKEKIEAFFSLQGVKVTLISIPSGENLASQKEMNKNLFGVACHMYKTLGMVEVTTDE